MSLKRKKKHDSKQSSHNFTCVDLFAGAGGFSLAAIKAGLKVISAVEFDKAAAITYEENIVKVQDPAPRLYRKDILDIAPDEFFKDTFKEDSECDIVLGGPPCQGFSVHRIKGSGVGDERNKLILRYFKFVSALQPKMFLMENVPGIMWARHREYLDEFYEEGTKAGYQILDPVTLDARDFGIPQRRKRVFILGVRKDIDLSLVSWPPKPTHGDDKQIQEDPKLKPWLNAQEIFSLPINANDENNVHMNHKPELVDVFRSTPLNGGSRHQSNRVLPCHVKHNGHQDVYGRIDPSKPAPTMTTACVNPSKGRFLHPTEHHGITVRHAARFQTFPDWYVFKGGLMAAAKQVGNAVPVDFGKILIKTMTKALDKYYRVASNEHTEHSI